MKYQYWPKVCIKAIKLCDFKTTVMQLNFVSCKMVWNHIFVFQTKLLATQLNYHNKFARNLSKQGRLRCLHRCYASAVSASPVNVAIKCLLKYKCLWTVFILLCHHRCDRWRRQEHSGQESKRKNLIFPWRGQLGTVNVLSAIFLLLTLCVVLKNNNPVSNVCIYLLVLLCVATTVPSCAWNDEEWNITVQSFCLYEEHLAQRMCG